MNRGITMTKPAKMRRGRGLLSSVLVVMAGCGPRVGSDGEDSSGATASPGETTPGHFDVSWAIGDFTMLRSNGEPSELFMGLEIPEEGRAIATRYDCDLDGGPAEPAVVTQMQWRAVSDSLIEFIPPAPGEKLEYAGSRSSDLFIERPAEGDGITVYSSIENDEWPRYGTFVRGRPCGYFEGGMSCYENFYFRVCPE
jgi:hypothetical protein